MAVLRRPTAGCLPDVPFVLLHDKTCTITLQPLPVVGLVEKGRDDRYSTASRDRAGRVCRHPGHVGGRCTDGRRRPGDPLTVSAAMDRLRIGEALAQLSAADRDLLRRSYYEGRTTAQIAEDLHIADDTVKSTLHHTVRALRRTL